ncbi:unnamed protein product [Urochloa decumbens]|uniref:DUF4220 domain-containing protein n=1 Tax=Urochloa decumbens TaxID=240449 RepID=A0ABC9ALC0_9POAL
MFDVWSAVHWWEDWQLRILVLGSLGLQWFLMLAAPMRKYIIPRFFRTCIWLAYVSSDALAIYALATLFNRHAKATTSSSCSGGIASILEVLWAPVLLIHLGGQEELTAYTIEDNEMWTRHTVTLVSQVAVALYAFYKSWPSCGVDWKLLASAILLFVIGVVSFSEKPFALNRASINRLASVSARVQGTKKPSRWGVYLDDLMFSDWYKFFTKSEDKQATGGHWYNCFTKSEDKKSGGGKVVLSEGDKVYMILSDLSLSATADDLVQRRKADKKEDVLGTLGIKAAQELKRWLRGAFGFIYTRANVVVHPVYLTYHLLVVPILHIAALTLFATSDKHEFNRTDVKTTYILLCFTAALDVLAVFIRQLLYMVLSKAGVPPLCETLPGYNIMQEVLRSGTDEEMERLAVKCRGCKEKYFDCRAGGNYKLYNDVMAQVMGYLVDESTGRRDLASYRIFNVPHLAPETPVEVERDEVIWLGPGFPDKNLCTKPNKAIDDDTEEIRVMVSPGAGSSSSFTATEHGRSAAPSKLDEAQLQHAETRGAAVATARWYQQPIWVTGQEMRQEAAAGGKKSSRTNWVLSESLQRHCGPEIRRTLRGSFDRCVLIWHIATDLCSRMDPEFYEEGPGRMPMRIHRKKGAAAISNYMAHLLTSRPDMLLTGSRRHLVTEAMLEMRFILKELGNGGQPPSPNDIRDIIDKGMRYKEGDSFPKNEEEEERSFFQIPQACRLAKELLDIDSQKRSSVMFNVWVGMLFYSASMCRGYLHAKSLGEGGEFLSLVWLVLSLKNGKTLADKLQMPDDEDTLA